jgi:hypothetical protein
VLRRKPERLEGERESLWLTVDVEFDRRRLQICGATARNFNGLAALQTREGEGEHRGARGLLIGTTGSRIVLGVMGI